MAEQLDFNFMRDSQLVPDQYKKTGGMNPANKYYEPPQNVQKFVSGTSNFTPEMKRYQSVMANNAANFERKMMADALAHELRMIAPDDVPVDYGRATAPSVQNTPKAVNPKISVNPRAFTNPAFINVAKQAGKLGARLVPGLGMLMTATDIYAAGQALDNAYRNNFAAKQDAEFLNNLILAP